MFFRILVIFMSLIITVNKSFSGTLKFKLNVQRDTVFIGEPLVITKVIENNSERPAVILIPGLIGNIESGKLRLHLFSPMKKQYDYQQTAFFTVLWDQIPCCTILPGKQIFTQNIVWWDHFIWGIENVKKLPTGKYMLLAEWYLPDKSDFVSETCQFYAIPLQGEDLKTYEILLREGRDYIMWWGRSSLKERKMMYQASAKALQRKSKVMREYAAFLHANSAEKEQRIELLKKFVEEFPKSPLTLQAKKTFIRSAWNIGKPVEEVLKEMKSEDRTALKKDLYRFKLEYPGYYEHHWEELLKKLNE